MYDKDKEMRRQAKMKVVDDLRSTAKGMMRSGVKDMNKVSVMSEDKEGLEKGLDEAKKLLHAAPELSKDPSAEEAADHAEESYPDPDKDHLMEGTLSLEDINAKIAELNEMKEKLSGPEKEMAEAKDLKKEILGRNRA